MTAVIRTKSEYHKIASERMRRSAHAHLNLRQKLALTCRILPTKAMSRRSPARSPRAATSRHALDAEFRARIRRSAGVQHGTGGRRPEPAGRRRHGQPVQPLPFVDLPPSAGRERHHPHASAVLLGAVNRRRRAAIAHMDTSMFYEESHFRGVAGRADRDEEGEIITKIGTKRATCLRIMGSSPPAATSRKPRCSRYSSSARPACN